MFEIVWEHRAVAEQKTILEYWNERNGSNEYSKKIFSEVERLLDTLEHHPHIGTSTNYKDIRRIIVLRRFSLYYKVVKNTIFVLSLWDNNRDIENVNL